LSQTYYKSLYKRSNSSQRGLIKALSPSELISPRYDLFNSSKQAEYIIPASLYVIKA